MRITMSVLLALACVMPVCAGEMLESPDGKVRVEFDVAKGGVPMY